MRKSVLAFLLVLVSVIAQAQAPAGYYSTANDKTGNELKIALHNIIKGHTVVSYNGLLDAFPYTDCDANVKIIDIYSNCQYTPNDYSSTYKKEGDGWNREHTWPQSWFNEKSGPKSDLFHVYPTDGYVNGKRSNYPYGEVNSPTYTSGNGSKLGPCVTTGYSGTVFEPIDEYKGDIARGFFYMSVRYAGEDSGWSTSAMTNKSEILSWAMTMLLRWSDEDPVSEKEIARNEAVYGFQNNRNPFIDHPEYARMIWDPNYTPADSYAITCATGLEHGSVTAPATAMEGTTVFITATPDAGYMVDSYSAYKTGSPSTTISVNDNGAFTMPDYAVTVSASFVQNTQNYTITKGDVSHGSISVSATSALSGTTINLTATPDSGYSLYSWYVYKTGDMNVTVEVNGNSFTMPAFDVTVIATFVEGSNGNYVKVTSAPSDWSGDYLLVYENNETSAYVWTGVDGANCYSEQTITGNTIANGNMVSITTAPMSGGYSIKVNGGTNNGKYISGSSNSNTINFGTSASPNTLSYESNSVIITSNSSVMRFNNANDQKRFRYFKSGTYSQQQPVQLYKKTSSSGTPTHSINYYPNEGTGSMDSQIVEEMVPTALTDNAFTRNGFVFDGWNTQADGTGDYYLNQAVVSLVSDLNLYAQWDQLYNITLAPVQHGFISTSAEHAVEGITINLTATPDENYTLDHWTVTYGDNTIDVEENQFEMPAANVTVSATFVYVGSPFVQQYRLVTSTDQLEAGKTYLIVNTTAGKALSKTQNSNNRAATAVTIVNNLIDTISNDVCELTLGESNNNWTFFDANKNGYLCAASSSSNLLKTQSVLDDDGRWTITIASNGSATIIAQGTNDRNNLRFNPNNGSPIFSCYASSSPMSKVELYVRTETFVLDIEGYTENGGWYTIATPFADFAPAQIAKGNYDLYAYDEDGELEWINYKTNPSSFPTSASSGYLYAHYPNTTLQMTGTPNDDSYTETVNLSYANSDTNLKGLNLLGNPTAHIISFTKTENVSDGYYYLCNSETWQYEPTNSVPVGRGFLVKANATGQTVTLNPQSRGDHAEATFLCLTIDNEKAYVKMDEGVSMPLLSFQGKSSSVYLTRDGKPYIMLAKDNADAIDVCFKPNRSGEHTLTVSATPNLNYLHLIDHRTGADIDLIANPSYRFESTSSDYASRFQLRFCEDTDTDSDLFAYYADGRIVVNAEGTLQIHDITGRRVENGPLATGVYILRLITPEKVRVQKIVID